MTAIPIVPEFQPSATSEQTWPLPPDLLRVSGMSHTHTWTLNPPGQRLAWGVAEAVLLHTLGGLTLLQLLRSAGGRLRSRSPWRSRGSSAGFREARSMFIRAPGQRSAELEDTNVSESEQNRRFFRFLPDS